MGPRSLGRVGHGDLSNELNSRTKGRTIDLGHYGRLSSCMHCCSVFAFGFQKWPTSVCASKSNTCKYVAGCESLNLPGLPSTRPGKLPAIMSVWGRWHWRLPWTHNFVEAMGSPSLASRQRKASQRDVRQLQTVGHESRRQNVLMCSHFNSKEWQRVSISDI